MQLKLYGHAAKIVRSRGWPKIKKDRTASNENYVFGDTKGGQFVIHRTLCLVPEVVE